MREIAEVLDLSESRISQLRSLAMARVRAALQELDIDSSVF
jgi:DNA-directed RNA polymerase specialized sigma subunit